MRAALYARFSTDKQRDESIDDQFRVCERDAARHGFDIVARYSDAAISGGTAQRPGYQQMLEAARRKEFDAIIAEDFSRLWRNEAEQHRCLADLHDLGVYVVAGFIDTRKEGAELLGSMYGAMNAQYLIEHGKKTYRGQEGNATRHKPTGGKAYGYVAARDSGTAEIEINPEEAAVIHRIFQMYADGCSPRTIAQRLNAEGVRSPGSTWKRKERRTDSKWLASTIYGDPKRNTGIINNVRYSGRIEWGKTKWHRSKRDRKKRRVEVLPKPAQVYQDERLRIIPQNLWDAVRARQAMLSATLGARVAKGWKKSQPQRTHAAGAGAPPRYLLSGLLRCGVCGASFQMSNGDRYQCASWTNGRACSRPAGQKGPIGPNRKSIKRSRIEQVIIETLRADLSDADVIAEVERLVREAVRAKPRATAQEHKRIEQLRTEIRRLTDAIAEGTVHSPRAIVQRLLVAEDELERLEARTKRADVTQMVPNVRDRFERLLSRLDSLLAPPRDGKTERGDRRAAHVSEQARLEAARATIMDVIGPRIDLVPENGGTELWAEWEPRFGELAQDRPLALAAGGRSGILVAGAGFEPATFGL